MKSNFFLQFFRSRDKDRSPKERNRDKERRSKSRDRHRRRSHSRERRSKDRERSKRHRREDERQNDDERHYEKEKERERKRELEEMREKELERERLREIAMELKAAQFAALAEVQVQPPMPLMPMQQMFVPEPPKPEVSQAFLEAVAASQRIAASKNFAEIYNCTNSNDSTSNGPTPIEETNNATSSNSKAFHPVLSLSGCILKRLFSIPQTAPNVKLGNGRNDLVGAAAKMTRHSSLECQLYCRHRWTHTSRRHI